MAHEGGSAATDPPSGPVQGGVGSPPPRNPGEARRAHGLQGNGEVSDAPGTAEGTRAPERQPRQGRRRVYSRAQGRRHRKSPSGLERVPPTRRAEGRASGPWWGSRGRRAAPVPSYVPCRVHGAKVRSARVLPLFESFPRLLSALGDLNGWVWKQGELADRVNSVTRKLLNAMFLVEAGTSIEPAKTGAPLEGMREMRAYDAYLEAAQGALHGAVDMLASALCTRYGLANRRGQPFSFNQLFQPSGTLEPQVEAVLDDAQRTALYHTRDMIAPVITSNNGAKHSVMPQRYSLPPDYPPYLAEMSRMLQPELSTGTEIHAEMGHLHQTVEDVGVQICEAAVTCVGR